MELINLNKNIKFAFLNKSFLHKHKTLYSFGFWGIPKYWDNFITLF